MGFWGFLAGAGLAGLLGLGIKRAKEDLKEKELEEQRRKEAIQKRKNTPCLFNDGVSYIEFVNIIERITKPIKRLSVSIDGPFVYGTVRTQSGISTWDFTLDFNDWGHITGTYWCWQENTDSTIPNSVGEQIKKEIEKTNNAV